MTPLEQLERYGYTLVLNDNEKIVIEKSNITVEYYKKYGIIKSYQGIFETTVSGTVVSLLKQLAEGKDF